MSANCVIRAFLIGVMLGCVGGLRATVGFEKASPYLQVNVAKEYFKVQETPALKIRNQDGRVFLNRTSDRYDVIIMDAYTTSRYGSSIPPHLTTREFFALASAHLTTNGVLAYNVIGQIQ